MASRRVFRRFTTQDLLAELEKRGFLVHLDQLTGEMDPFPVEAITDNELLDRYGKAMARARRYHDCLKRVVRATQSFAGGMAEDVEWTLPDRELDDE